MSTTPLRCSTCDAEGVYVRCAPFPPGQEAMYGVVWRCPKCQGDLLDICPLGPLVPDDRTCMNCGGSYRPNEDVCTACGLSKDACPAALGVTEPGHEQAVVTAQADFRTGLFRRGLAVLNYALLRTRTKSDAWIVKAQFMHSLGFNHTAAEMLEAALACGCSNDQQVQLLEEQSFLWAECNRGDEALASADAAWRLASNSVRTHYLRGRGLALIGRLAEARDEMLQVLAQDRDNPDARRGLSMIENVLRPANKKWWQFWKA